MTDEEARLAHVRRVAHDLRPQDFKPWNQARRGGWTLEQALVASVVAGQRGTVSSYLARVDAGIEQPVLQVRMREWLWHLLRDRLLCAELFAQGRELGESQVTRLPSDAFDDAEPDFRRNRLICFAKTFCSIRVLSAASVAPLDQLNQKASSKPDSASASTVTYSNGSPGRPTSKHLYMPEFEARFQRGETQAGILNEATQIAVWLRRKHPEAAAASPRSIENAIRHRYRVLIKPIKR